MTVGKVVLNGSVSLDGYSAGPNPSDDHPMGEGGERLHEWMFAEGSDRDAEFAATVGAVVLGRRTFDLGLRFWQDTPFPVPSFVLTHEGRPPLAMKSASFTFVTDGPKSAVGQAREAAGDKDVLVMAAAESAQHVLRAGLVDEIRLQLVPVFLGGGARLLDGLKPTELERIAVAEADDVVHLRFRVLK
ncbi:dihydrofolate reductase [Saccharothrix ecbatanensis]|uniref:Dihydrofolate reductase n=1 Tax=Saccharothrix ecbatanensis TaxID=1105145 RepID=A0A7W9M2E8_9PSEU|nr:dihydrofolate reductase family protein [Saccharothrix ecbatanensis]MBB5804881.1 dihydrofolate reductase [Saccharothrix ecbatanensis]